jgi:hypothetical protein
MPTKSGTPKMNAPTIADQAEPPSPEKTSRNNSPASAPAITG